MKKNVFMALGKSIVDFTTERYVEIRSIFLVFLFMSTATFFYINWGTAEAKESIYIFLPPVFIMLAESAWKAKTAKRSRFSPCGIDAIVVALTAFLLGTRGIETLIVYAVALVIFSICFSICFDVLYEKASGIFIFFSPLVLLIWVIIITVIMFQLAIIRDAQSFKNKENNAQTVVVEKASPTGKSIMFDSKLYEISCNKTAAENDTIKAVIGSDGTIIWLEKVTKE